MADDVTMTVKAFLCGHNIPWYVTHTNLILLPKKKVPRTFLDMRPISLSNFINKVISRVLHDGLVKYLPSIISQNQARFVKSRSMVANVFLAQEIIRDINKRNQHVNVVVKLDMAKAHDSVMGISD